MTKFPCEKCNQPKVSIKMLRVSPFCLECQVIRDIERFGWEKAVTNNKWKIAKFNLSLVKIKEMMNNQAH